MTNENKIFKVYTRRIAYELRKKGFKILGTDINEYHPEFTIWLFQETEEFLNAFKELANHKR